jgi:beta-glucosidase
MPGPARLRGPLAELAVSSRKVARTTIDERARNLLEFVERANRIDVAEEEGIRDLPEDRALNRKLAADSVVLLKNEKGLLPLRKDIKKIALIGPNLKDAAFCGGGSASLEPYYTVSPYKGIFDKLGDGVQILYEAGPQTPGYLPVLQAPNITTPDGLPGCRLRFYREPPDRRNREVVDEVVVSETNWQLMGFSHPKLGRLFFVDVETILIAPASGKFEFGLAVYGSGNLYLDGQLIIDNTTVQREGKFFLGKGTWEEKAMVSLVESRSYKIKVEFASSPSSKLVKPGVISLGGGAGRLGLAEMLDDDVTLANAVRAAKESEVTILCAG